MKRLFCFAVILILFALPFTLPALAGHAVIGAGQTVYCDCGCPPPCVCDSNEDPVEHPKNCPGPQPVEVPPPDRFVITITY
jgi:hypothetical protein